MLVNGLKIVDLIKRHSEEKIHGRKRLQKTVYILKHFGFEYDERFTYLHYGPYSYDLFDETKQLVNWNFISQENNGSEYIYILTNEGKNFLEKYSHLFTIKRQPSVRIIKVLEENDSGVLELLSTYYYLIDQGIRPAQAWFELEDLKPDRIHLKERAQELDKELVNAILK